MATLADLGLGLWKCGYRFAITHISTTATTAMALDLVWKVLYKLILVPEDHNKHKKKGTAFGVRLS